jgi:hypothetical protein
MPSRQHRGCNLTCTILGSWGTCHLDAHHRLNNKIPSSTNTSTIFVAIANAIATSILIICVSPAQSTIAASAMNIDIKMRQMMPHGMNTPRPAVTAAECTAVWTLPDTPELVVSELAGAVLAAADAPLPGVAPG